MKQLKNKMGQILLAGIWLVLFTMAFLTMLSHLYEKGKKEIKLIRLSTYK